MDARARDRRARGGAEDGDGDARVETRRGGAIGGADGTNGKAHPERAPAYLAVGGSSQEGLYGGRGVGARIGDRRERRDGRARDAARIAVEIAAAGGLR